MSERPAPVVHAYSADALADLLVKGSARAVGEDDNPFVRTKQHVAFFQEYMRTQSCASIVEEPSYIDRDFLEDFAAYHVRSFHKYDRFCTRLHFFSKPLDQATFENVVLRHQGASSLQQSYIGFVVVRPLPLTVIGRTCLKPYPPKRGVQRSYPTTYEQVVDLCGVTLRVETVAFQEQDRDVAACATSALWSVLQRTGRDFQHAIPSPVAITGTAAATGGYDERMLPAVAGLTIRQIADTLRYVGLEPHLIPLEVTDEDGARSDPETSRRETAGGGAIAEADEGDLERDKAERRPTRVERAIEARRLELKIATAAYLRAGIPCLLLLRVTKNCGDEPERHGNHAVAVTGYRIGKDKTVGYGESGVHFDASRIDKLFVHDDQVGPFAKMQFADDGSLVTPWPDSGFPKAMSARSHTLVVPLNHKIRIPFDAILALTLSIARQLDATQTRFGKLLGDQVVTWDIRLSTLTQFRADVVESNLNDERKLELLKRDMPKYVWRVTAEIERSAVLELVLDATDLMQGELLLEVVLHSDMASSLFATVFKAVGRSFDETPALRKIRSALAGLKPPPEVAAVLEGANRG